jgi:hypothetical protein
MIEKIHVVADFKSNMCKFRAPSPLAGEGRDER